MAYIYVFDGQMGSGKTAAMSLMALQMACQFPNLTLWSNYGMKYSFPFTSYKNFLDMASLESSVVLLDEAYYTLDSRNFSSKGQVQFTQLINYLRKLRVTMFVTAVDMNTLDSRLRSIIDVYVVAKKRGGYHIYEFFDFQTERLLKRSSIPIAKMKFLLQQLDMYKTWKIVRPTELPNGDFHEFVANLDHANDQFYTPVVNGGSLRGP